MKFNLGDNVYFICCLYNPLDEAITPAGIIMLNGKIIEVNQKVDRPVEYKVRATDTKPSAYLTYIAGEHVVFSSKKEAAENFILRLKRLGDIE